MTVELEEMETESADNSSSEEENYTMMKLLKTNALHMPLVIAIMLQVIQQLSGINAVSLFFTTEKIENSDGTFDGKIFWDELKGNLMERYIAHV